MILVQADYKQQVILVNPPGKCGHDIAKGRGQKAEGRRQKERD